MTNDRTAGSAGLMIDSGALSPLTVGCDAAVSDTAFLSHLIAVEAALTIAWGELGVAPDAAVTAVASALLPEGFEPGQDAPLARFDPAAVVAEASAGGNPVIPLVAQLRRIVPEPGAAWVHRGATSQDIMDTALMCLARDAVEQTLDALDHVTSVLADFARDHSDDTAAARTLTQHAVPTTVGLRASNWARGISRAALRLDDALRELPAQLGGAGGTLASFVATGGVDAARELPLAFAEAVGLAAPEAPWHTQRWPVTELGDALAQALDALGKLAADVATLSRTEIGELAEGSGGGSSAMPQKRNPAGSVLIRSAAIRAPYLAATLHSAAALAVDERPDGAWHAEWQTLRELLRLALGASAHAVTLVEGLRVDEDAVRRNLALTGGLIVAERLSLELGPLIGAHRVKQLVAAAGAGEDLATLLAALLAAEPALDGLDVAALLDPAHYTGLAPELASRIADEFDATPLEEIP
ncbi:MAG: lyase family protein [Leucobacter sp.]